jgi:hypothetical protein
MAHYIHHLPGRLRIKSHQLKRNATRAASVRELLLNMDGVMGADANTVTGSLLVSYDKDRTCPRELLETLKRAGCCTDSVQLPDGVKSTAGRLSDSLTGAGDAVGKAVVGVLVEKVVERSAFALIGAIL